MQSAEDLIRLEGSPEPGTGQETQETVESGRSANDLPDVDKLLVGNSHKTPCRVHPAIWLQTLSKGALQMR